MIVTFLLKPKKNKANSIVSVWNKSEPINNYINKSLEIFKQEYKGRTVISLVVEYPINIDKYINEGRTDVSLVLEYPINKKL